MICFSACSNDADSSASSDTTSYEPSSTDGNPGALDPDEPVGGGTQDTSGAIHLPNDSAGPPPPPPPPGEKLAYLGFSHPDKLRRKELKHINVILKVVNSESTVRNTLDSLNEDQDVFDLHDSRETYVHNMLVYKYVTAELRDPQKIFKIEQIHDSNYQQVDTVNGNRWDWAISTDSDLETGTLILKVKAHKPDGGLVMLRDKQIPVVIDIKDSTFFRKAWIYINENPWTVITVVLLPALAFLLRRYIFPDKKV